MRTSLARLVFALLFLAAPALATTVDGFVTQIDSAGAFDVGTLHVVLTKSAQCEVGEGQTANPLSFYKNYAFGKSLFHAAKTTSIPCAALHIDTGSRLSLEGILQPDGRRFLASRVVLYSIKQVELLEGGAMLEEEPSIQQKNGGWFGTFQVDGYPLNITPQTRMVAAPDDTTFIHSVHQHILTIRAKVNPAWPEAAFSSSLLKPNTWAVYHAVDSGNGSNAASQIRFWPNRTSVGETRYLEGFIAKISKDDVTKLPSSIQLRHGNAINILPDRSIQDWVSRVGMGLVPIYQKSLPDSDTTKIHFQFYVVRLFHAPFASGLVDINGVLPYSDGTEGFEYHNPAIFTQVKDVIGLPMGIILIPDQALASLQNEAQLAALLSCSVTSVLQKQAYLAQHHSNGFYFVALWLRLNEQALRIGIRQM